MDTSPENPQHEDSNGNVFADLGLDDAEALQEKSGLVGSIHSVMRERGLGIEQASQRMGGEPEALKALLGGSFDSVPARELRGLLERLER